MIVPPDAEEAVSLWREAFRARAAGACLLTPGGSVTWRELDDRVEWASDVSWKHRLAGAVVRLDPVLGVETLSRLLALAQCRAVAAWGGDGTRGTADDQLRRLGPLWEWPIASAAPRFRADPAGTPAGAGARLRERGHAGLVLQTSGTTGVPRAVLHDLTAWLNAFGGKAASADVVVPAMRFDHVGGLDAALRAVGRGATLAVPARLDAAAVAGAVAAHRANVLIATPTLLNLMFLAGVFKPQELASLRLVGFGGEPMPPPVLARLQQALPQARFRQRFGTTETGGVQVRTADQAGQRLRFDDPSVQVRVVQGELWMKSGDRAVGYIDDTPGALGADGWLRTGDLVEQCVDGAIRFLGRLQCAINVGGSKVLPEMVEALLLELTDVADCRVYGEPHPLMGQVVAVELVPASGVPEQQLRQLVRDHCSRRLERHQQPVHVRVVPQLAVTPTGKKQRATRGAPAG